MVPRVNFAPSLELVQKMVLHYINGTMGEAHIFIFKLIQRMQIEFCAIQREFVRLCSVIYEKIST